MDAWLVYFWVPSYDNLTLCYRATIICYGVTGSTIPVTTKRLECPVNRVGDLGLGATTSAGLPRVEVF